MALTNAHSIVRLQNLARVMQEVIDHKKNFEMQCFAGTADADWGLFSDTYSRKLIREGACGTAACAAGWAGLDPWFRKTGFKTVAQRNSVYIDGEEAYSGDFALYFGIRDADACNLFYDMSNTPQDVLDKVNALIADKQTLTAA